MEFLLLSALASLCIIASIAALMLMIVAGGIYYFYTITGIPLLGWKFRLVKLWGMGVSNE